MSGKVDFLGRNRIFQGHMILPMILPAGKGDMYYRERGGRWL